MSASLDRIMKELRPGERGSLRGRRRGDRPGLEWPAVLGVLAGAVATTGCEVVKGIFKAGFWVGVVVVVAIVALAGFAIHKLSG